MVHAGNPEGKRAVTPPRLLSRDEFLRCFTPPMRDVTATAEPAADIWRYIDAADLPPGSVGDVAHVYRDAGDRFDQVLIATDRDDLFLVVVVGIAARRVRGHYLLDLAAEYGG